MDRIGTALIGCGKVADAHAGAYQSLPESNFIGVFDVNPSRAAALAAQYGVEAFGNLEEMLRDPRVQAASICTPHPTHPKMVEACARALAEKLVDFSMLPAAR